MLEIANVAVLHFAFLKKIVPVCGERYGGGSVRSDTKRIAVICFCTCAIEKIADVTNCRAQLTCRSPYIWLCVNANATIFSNALYWSLWGFLLLTVRMYTFAHFLLLICSADLCSRPNTVPSDFHPS